MPGRELFDELVTEGFSAVERWVREERGESVHVEFKGRSRHPSAPTAPSAKLDDSDKGTISRAIAAFANTDGGVLVFGLTTEKVSGAADRLAASQAYLSQPATLAASFSSSVKDMVTPAVPGLDVQPIVRADGSGVIAIYVPSSGVGPHRAEFGKDAGKYLIRTADNTSVMPHGALAALFGRVPPPRLELSAEISRRPDGPGVGRFFLRNDGRGSAILPAVVIYKAEVSGVVEYNGSYGRIRAASGFAFLFRSQLERLYPGIEDEIFSFSFRAPPELTLWKAVFHGAIYADSMQPLRFTASLDALAGDTTHSNIPLTA